MRLNPFRRREEKRAITGVPWNVGALNPQQVTEKRALGLAAVYAANRHLGDLISTLPLRGYRSVGDRRERMNRDPELFRTLEERGTLGPWLFECVTSLGLHGNAVGAILRFDGFSHPADVVWLPMNEVSVDDANVLRPQWYWKGRKVATEELVHIPWFKLPGRTLGLSPIEAYALTISNGLGAQQYGTTWFDNGGIPPGSFRNQAKTINRDEAEEIAERLVASIRRRRPLVFGNDWEYTPITVPPDQAQFISTMKLTANQIAAIYGIAPDEIGGEAANSQTYMNEEHRETRRVADARPWIVRLENAFSSWLPEAQYMRFGVDAVIRGDIKTRYESYKIAREIGLMSVDEVRALEELGPVPGGNTVAPLQRPQSSPAIPVARLNGHSPEWSMVP